MTINFLNIAQVLVAVALIIFILIQRGPGATAGSAFGGGASGTVFGAKGSGSFLTKSTAILATLFFIITMLIAIDAKDSFASSEDPANQDLGVFGSLDAESQEPSVVAAGDEVQADVAGVIDAVEQSADQLDENASNVTGTASQIVDETVQTVDEAANDVQKVTTEESNDEDSDGGN